MGLDWGNLLDEWDGKNYWESLAWENCSGPKKNLGDFSNRDCMFASKDYAAAVSRPRQVFQWHLLSMKDGALFKDMVRCLIV